MNEHQRTALGHFCRLACETAHPRFLRIAHGGLTVVLTVNVGYE